MKSLSAELIAIVAAGVALAGLLIIGQHRLEDRLISGQLRLEERLISDQHRLENRLASGQHRLEERLLAVETVQARVNVLLEGAGFTVRHQDSSSVRK